MWNDPKLIELFSKKIPLIDVRAPVEFQAGSIPYSINLPIMNDEERHLIGTCYKEFGQEKAIQLGHELVSGDLKAHRIKMWRDYIEEFPEAQVFCFRGGLRSQITCEWIDHKDKKPLPGGYKRLRHFFLSWLEESPLPRFIRLGGLTGNGKTRLLPRIQHHLDIEGLAHHRGSAFGTKGKQPSQITFENLIALGLMNNTGKTLIVEDESATLGKVFIPKRIFSHMRESPLVILEVDPVERINNIFEDYVRTSNADFFIQGVKKIEKRLGAIKVKILSDDITEAFSKPLEASHHEKWISTLLAEYYDPLYQKDLRYNEDKVLFRGKKEEVLAFLADH
jgi:tRNA 2-selenouridine synthase